MKETLLKNEHIALGAKMVDFAGWYMPVQYKGLIQEHLAVRTAVGLFDVSHMGEIRVKGENALKTLQYLTTNDVSKLKAGEAQYSLFPNKIGGLVDDLIVYCVKPNEEYLLCVNASNTDKDYEFLLENNLGAEIVNESNIFSQIAVQGPKAMTLLSRLFENVESLKNFTFMNAPYKGETVIIAKTGYTGEDGVEIFIPNAVIVDLWRELLEKGKDLGVEPIGLGARDTLRTEMKYSLYGHEINDQINPYSAGLGWVIKPDAKDFLSKDLILKAKESISQKLIGFLIEDKGIARADYKIVDENGNPLGYVTSGTLSPSLNQAIGIGYVSLSHASLDSIIYIDIRGRRVRARVVKTPFIKK